MKNLAVSMLAMASIAAMVSCSSNNDPVDEVGNGEKVEIKLSAGLISTKAPIENGIGDNANYPSANVLLDLIAAPDAATAVWTAINTVASKPNLTTNGIVDFSSTTKLYYNANETLKSHILAYSPSGDNTTAGSVTWTIDGSNDIIVAQAVSGSKSSVVGALTFEHLLTQLQVEVQGDAAAISTFGNITSIQVKDALTKPKMTFTDDKVTTLDWTNSDKATLKVFTPGTNNAISSASITNTFTSVGYIMLQPAASYTLLITTEKMASKEVTVTMENTAAAGSAHKIQLTFSATSIEPTATLTGWKTSTDKGTGTVE